MPELKIFEHELVPKHRILEEEEKLKLLEAYGVSLKELPKISLNDPAVKALKAKVGDVIEIERIDPMGKSKYYRVVVKT